MPQYLQDLDLNSDRDVHTDDANDLALTSGRENLEQSVSIGAGDAIDQFIGSNIDGTTIALLEENLREALDADPQVSVVQSVDVEKFDRRDNSISVAVSVDEDEDFLLEVSP